MFKTDFCTPWLEGDLLNFFTTPLVSRQTPVCTENFHVCFEFSFWAMILSWNLVVTVIVDSRQNLMKFDEIFLIKKITNCRFFHEKTFLDQFSLSTPKFYSLSTSFRFLKLLPFQMKYIFRIDWWIWDICTLFYNEVQKFYLKLVLFLAKYLNCLLKFIWFQKKCFLPIKMNSTELNWLD